MYACVDHLLTVLYFRRGSQEALRLCTLSHLRMPQKPKMSVPGWRLMAGGSELIIPLPSGHTLQLREYTWVDPHRKYDGSFIDVRILSSLFYHHC